MSKISLVALSFEDSFASHPQSKFWSDKNILKPEQVAKNTRNKYYLICEVCEHEIYVVLSELKNGSRCCVYCNNKKLCDDNNCMKCFEKSFSSSSQAKYWSNKNQIDSRTVFLNSNKKYYFELITCCC